MCGNRDSRRAKPVGVPEGNLARVYAGQLGDWVSKNKNAIKHSSRRLIAPGIMIHPGTCSIGSDAVVKQQRFGRFDMGNGHRLNNDASQSAVAWLRYGVGVAPTLQLELHFIAPVYGPEIFDRFLVVDMGDAF